MKVNAKSGFVAALFVALALVPVAAEVLDQPFYMLVAQRIMILAIAALSLNLLMGYGGMISFGHAVYVGIGAYAVGIAGFYGITNRGVQLALVVWVAAVVALAVTSLAMFKAPPNDDPASTVLASTQVSGSMLMFPGEAVIDARLARLGTSLNTLKRESFWYTGPSLPF